MRRCVCTGYEASKALMSSPRGCARGFLRTYARIIRPGLSVIPRPPALRTANGSRITPIRNRLYYKRRKYTGGSRTLRVIVIVSVGITFADTASITPWIMALVSLFYCSEDAIHLLQLVVENTQIVPTKHRD